MRYLGWILLSLLALECLSIVLVTHWLGAAGTLTIIFITFISGFMMLRHLGFSGVLLIGASLRSGQPMSLYQLLWPIRYIVAALMLMSPGFFSDLIALLLLLPITGHKHTYNNIMPQKMDSDIIDGDYTVQTEKTTQSSSSTTPKLPK